MNNKKELITAVEKVRSYCHNQENCLDCIFYDIDLDRCNIQGIPDDWVYSRFSQDEVQLAKILKKYGICRIARKGPVAYKEIKGGKEKIVTPNGEVISCTFDAEPEEMTGIGYIPHWSTCPQANSFRKR